MDVNQSGFGHLRSIPGFARQVGLVVGEFVLEAAGAPGLRGLRAGVRGWARGRRPRCRRLSCCRGNGRFWGILEEIPSQRSCKKLLWLFQDWILHTAIFPTSFSSQIDSLTQFLFSFFFFPFPPQQAPWRMLLTAVRCAYEGDLWHCHSIWVTERCLVKESDPESRGSGVVFFPSQF